MRSGSVDLFTSRRTNYVECRYWIARDEQSGTLTEYDLDIYEDGTFYAKEENAETLGFQVVANDAMFEQQNVTLSTMDDVSDIVVNSIVEYEGNNWRVMDIQKTKIKKQNSVSNDVAYKYYLSLRR